MTCFGEMCQQLACVGKVHTQRMCWPGRTGDVHAEETCVRFLVIVFAGTNGRRWPSLAAIFPQKVAPHTSLSHYLPKYQITRNSRIASEQPEVQHDMVICQ